jgi:hypothetical protein
MKGIQHLAGLQSLRNVWLILTGEEADPVRISDEEKSMCLSERGVKTNEGS